MTEGNITWMEFAFVCAGMCAFVTATRFFAWLESKYKGDEHEEEI